MKDGNHDICPNTPPGDGDSILHPLPDAHEMNAARCPPFSSPVFLFSCFPVVVVVVLVAKVAVGGGKSNVTIAAKDPGRSFRSPFTTKWTVGVLYFVFPTRYMHLSHVFFFFLCLFLFLL